MSSIEIRALSKTDDHEAYMRLLQHLTDAPMVSREEFERIHALREARGVRTLVAVEKKKSQPANDKKEEEPTGNEGENTTATTTEAKETPTEQPPQTQEEEAETAPADVPAVTATLESTPAGPVDTEEAPVEEVLIGTASVVIEPKFFRGGGLVGHIEDVVVDPAFRGQRIASKLVDALTGVAKAEGCYKVILDCGGANIPLYTKMGFQLKEYQMRKNI